MNRAILQIAFGPLAGHKIVLDPGAVVRVGRSADADVAITHDRGLAHVHFEIDWDGRVAQVRHRQGDVTLLGGRPVDQADVPHGGFLRAGHTFFLVHHEARTAAPPIDDARRAGIADALAAESDLWGILDAARSEAVLRALRESVDPARSLYEGPQGDALADAAPWLVRFRPDSRLLERVVHEGWGDAWGIFLTWRGSEKELRRHLRRFLLVEEEDTRKRLYMRFYDPRALRDLVPTCSVRQLHALFGEIEALFAEGETGDLLRFARADIHALADEDPS